MDSNFRIGNRVGIMRELTNSERPQRIPATIRYLGPTQFASGDWIGLELDMPSIFNLKFCFI